MYVSTGIASISELSRVPVKKKMNYWTHRLNVQFPVSPRWPLSGHKSGTHAITVSCSGIPTHSSIHRSPRSTQPSVSRICRCLLSPHRTLYSTAALPVLQRRSSAYDHSRTRPAGSKRIHGLQTGEKFKHPNCPHVVLEDDTNLHLSYSIIIRN